ncbi:Uncharacterised protein [Shigella sonnei]|nr:Uncharacterised protein [Shigella sonnei]
MAAVVWVLRWRPLRVLLTPLNARSTPPDR